MTIPNFFSNWGKIFLHGWNEVEVTIIGVQTAAVAPRKEPVEHNALVQQNRAIPLTMEEKEEEED